MQNWKKLLVFSLFVNVLLAGALFFLIHRLGGVKFMVHKIQSDGLAGIYENRKNLFEILPAPKGSIIFLGDSITEHGQWEELMGNPKVKNRGIAGDTTWGLLRRLKNITSQKPARIFLMIGVNDFLFTDRREIFENYQKIIEKIKSQSPDTQIFIQSILPVNPEVKNMVFNNQEIRLLNEDLKKLAKNTQIPYLNIHDSLTDKNRNLAAKYTADGIHLNGAAYIVWKKIVEKSMPSAN